MKSPHANKNPNPKQRVTQKNVKANCATIIYDAARRNVGFKVGANLCWRYIGAVALFFGGGLAIVGLSRAGLIKSSMPFDLWIIVSMTAGAVIGGSLGYLVFRKSRLSDPDYYKPF
jgi:hypothetical protein